MKYTLRLGAKWFATNYFACSEKAGRWLFGDKEYNKGNVLLVRNAVDEKRFTKNDDTTTQLRNKYDLENKFVVACVGRMTYAKNHEFVLEVFKEIKKLKNNAKGLWRGL